MTELLRGLLLLTGVFTLLITNGCSKNKNDITGKPNDEEDITPPEAIVDLAAAVIGEYDVELRWTAPADSGEGCVEYDLRMAMELIDDANFVAAEKIAEMQHPQPAGASEGVFVAQLETDSTYYFALKTRDEDSNWSALSNCLEVKTRMDSIAVFADSALEQAVRVAISRPNGILRRSYLRSIQAINADQAGIDSLKGIEYCTNLRQVNLPRNQIKDITPLAELSLLRIVNLIGNQVTSLSPLAGADNLEHVLINHNPVTSVSPLGTCAKLTILRADDTAVRDFTPIAGLPDLAVLNVSHNDLDNLEFVSQLQSLTELIAAENRIRDLEPLLNLSELEFLALPENQISDLAPLRGLPALGLVDLTSNQVSDLLPLVQNPGFGQGDFLIVRSNPLSDAARDDQIPALRFRGVNVSD